MKTLTEARADYRNYRAKTALPTARFDEIAARLVHELCDGEDVQPWHWSRAAEMVATGTR